MLIKIVSAISYLVIVGLVILLVMMLSENSSGSDAATKGIGSSIIMLAIAAIVFLLLFNLLSNGVFKYIGLGFGFLCVIALIVMFLALSGSSLIFQDTRSPFKPYYEDPKLDELFAAFQNGKVKQWKTLLKDNPGHLHDQQLLKDILSDANADTKSNARKLECLRYLFDAGVKMDQSLCGDFVWVAYSGKVDMTELLLQHGADPNCPFEQEQNKPVIFKTIEGYPNEGRVIDLLIKYGADVNAKIYDNERLDWITPLLYAVYREHWIFCKALLRNGANLNYKTKDGVSIKELIVQKASDIKAQGYSPDYNLLKLVDQIEDKK